MLVKPSQLWSNLIKLGQTRFKLVLFGTGHYIHCLQKQNIYKNKSKGLYWAPSSVLALVADLECPDFSFLLLLYPRIKISVNTDISVIEFYGNIENIGKISVDIFTKISVIIDYEK